MSTLFLSFFAAICSSLADQERCNKQLDVRIEGSHNAGPLEGCYSSYWWPACGNVRLQTQRNQSYWNTDLARQMCQRLHFTNPNYQDHQAFIHYECLQGNSCFDLNCVSSKSSQCSILQFISCNHRAAVICDYAPPDTLTSQVLELTTSAPREEFPTEVEHQTTSAIVATYPCSMSPFHSNSSRTNATKKEEICNCNKVGGALGGVIGILLLLLLCTIIGWVLSYLCHRPHSRNEDDNKEGPLDNPIYDGSVVIRGTFTPARNGHGMSTPTRNNDISDNKEGPLDNPIYDGSVVVHGNFMPPLNGHGMSTPTRNNDISVYDVPEVNHSNKYEEFMKRNERGCPTYAIPMKTRKK